MEIEVSFPIEILEDKACDMITVGDLFDYIVANSNVPTNRSVCLSKDPLTKLLASAATDHVAASLPDAEDSSLGEARATRSLGRVVATFVEGMAS